MKKLPKISIITIVYNGVATLEKTIKSVAAQTYSNVEYVIVDGGSKDGTLALIKQYDTVVSKWVSEPDDGLYDAMNKGMKLATGDYFWFINSGDEIYESTTLERIFWDANGPFHDVYYGDTIMIDEKGNEIGDRRLKPPGNLCWKDFRRGMLVSHQSIIVSRRVAPMYNLHYRFSADFEWCLLALKHADRVVNTHQMLSRFLDGGITKQNILPGLKERFHIMTRYFGFIPTVYKHVGIASRFFWFLARHRRF
ncbi:glycosyltransferase [Marinilabiliaceae bacterium JC017]|nr:glycosyltransferase [Marinilabiliaceae bacterium JC017]